MRQTGPILLTTGEFDLLTTADFGTGPIVIPSRSWILTVAAVVVGLVACGILALDLSEKASDSERLKLANHAVETEIATLKSQINATDALVRDLERDRAALDQVHASESQQLQKASALEAALKGELRREINNGDARVVRKGTRVTTMLEGWAVLDDTAVSLRGVDLLIRAGGILAAENRKLDVAVFTDDGARDPWGTTAAQAAAVAAFLEENAEIPTARLAATGRGSADPIGRNRARNRRVEIVVDYR